LTDASVRLNPRSWLSDHRSHGAASMTSDPLDDPRDSEPIDEAVEEAAEHADHAGDHSPGDAAPRGAGAHEG
jgi:hypothetical protein